MTLKCCYNCEYCVFSGDDDIVHRRHDSGQAECENQFNRTVYGDMQLIRFSDRCVLFKCYRYPKPRASDGTVRYTLEEMKQLDKEAMEVMIHGEPDKP
jgi:hypothetical protein